MHYHNNMSKNTIKVKNTKPVKVKKKIIKDWADLHQMHLPKGLIITRDVIYNS
jgi:hypothetical protein